MRLIGLHLTTAEKFITSGPLAPQLFNLHTHIRTLFEWVREEWAAEGLCERDLLSINLFSNDLI